MRKLLLASAIMSSSVATSLMAAPVINEVDSDNPSTDTAEFVELYDGGAGNTSLDGYALVFFNGSNDSSYKTIDLSGQVTDSNGYFVVCGDAEYVVNCDLDVSPNSNLIQNGADAVALYQVAASQFPNGSAITTNNLVDALVYDTNDGDDSGLLPLLNAGQPQVNEGGAGDKDNHSNQRCGEGIARNSDGYQQLTPTPGAVNACGGVDPDPEPTLGECGDSTVENYALISAVQGHIIDISNDASPLSGQKVIVEAIVTADLQGGALANGDSSYQYSGFWLQEEASDSDGNDNTSEGVFVYDYRNAVNVGDKVRLMASVAEFNNTTQLKSVDELVVCSSGNDLPTAASVTLPVASLEALEAVEGMRVQTNQELIVSDLFGTGYGFGNYGQFVVSSKLHYQPTEIALPGSAEAQAAADARPLDVLLVDDGVSASYPSFIPFPDDSGFSADNPMRIGYSVRDLEGVMHGWRNNYTVIPSNLTIDPTAPRTLEPVISEEADLVVVGMNVLNFFNGDGQGGGFPTSRGAPTYDAFTVQTDKIVAALTAMNADVVALMEIENDGFDANSAIQDLVVALNRQQQPGNEYSFVNPGVSAIGTDAISVGLLYRTAKLNPTGDTVILNSDNSPVDDNGDPLFIDDKNRPSLIQSFDYQGETFTLSVNHLKSKGSACNEVNEGQDGQGNCNLTRTKAAQALTQFLATQPTGVETDKVMILGDLNAYSQEDPMQVFYGDGFTNLKYTDKASEEKPFSYSFSGFLGSLDHALASDALVEHVVSVDAWHINSVEDSMVDYLTETNGQPYDSIDHYASPDAYRSSDHDPIVVGLRFENTAPEQVDEISDLSLTSMDQEVELDLSDYFTDADGDSLSYQVQGLPAGFAVSDQGVITAELTDASFEHLPATVSVIVSDGRESVSAEFDIVDNRPQPNPWQRLIDFLRWLFGMIFGR
ncbi:ExeM/NucH family extracellular endonuclease [Litoribrevibacter euphylliae]|uniref:ExeM/NucH family extracellular endonuclease n=1 Tax=Litoribrevibacter euphylliae TaxID=1834034 RepID=A0ABV7HEI1_9GAMM